MYRIEKCQNYGIKTSNSRFPLLSYSVAYGSSLFIFFRILDTISDKILSSSRTAESLPACFALVDALINTSGGGD